jgi:hypothetical protein
MPVFELTFEIPAISEAIEDRIVDSFDALIAGHRGVITATIAVDAPTCVSAASHLRAELSAMGANPLRLVDDLVSRTEIAERAGVTRQAVGMWLNGARRQARVFPTPLVLSGGGLWLWGEIVSVLRTMNIDPDPGIEFPTRRDSALINGLLVSRSLDLTSTFFASATADGLTVVQGHSALTYAVTAPEPTRTELFLAA